MVRVVYALDIIIIIINIIIESRWALICPGPGPRNTDR